MKGLSFDTSTVSELENSSVDQGEPIGRIFAYWVVAYFGQGFLLQNQGKFMDYFSPKFFYFRKKWVGLHFGQLFQNLIWSPCC
jgi:hypothetical protein